MLYQHNGYFNRPGVEKLVKEFATKYGYDLGNNTEQGIDVINIIDNTDAHSGELIIEMRPDGFWIELQQIDHADEVTGELQKWAQDGTKVAEIINTLKVFSSDYEFDRILQQDDNVILFWVRRNGLTLVIAAQKHQLGVKLTHQDTRGGVLTTIEKMALDSHLSDVETVVNGG